MRIIAIILNFVVLGIMAYLYFVNCGVGEDLSDLLFVIIFAGTPIVNIIALWKIRKKVGVSNAKNDQKQ